MKKRLLGFLLGVMLISVCVGCGAENTTTEPTETATETTTEESTSEQTEAPTETPEETVEPTPEAKEEPREETTAETEPETTEPMETAEPEPTEEPTPETEPQAIYTYTDMSATMYAQQTVNVRDLPDTSGNKIGSLSANDEIKISGQCNETGWYMFEYNDSVAFVSNKYLSENKVEIQTTPTDNSGSGTGSASGAFNEADYYPYQIINKGGTNVYYVMGIDPDANETASYQCDAIVSENLGVELGYHGGGSYYWFPTHYNPSSDPNEVRGLFFPYYTESNGHYLGQPADTKEN